ncbi:MAG TPA: hypothetical protein VF706_04630 [Solirubrobacteraceae bacterium]
MEDKQQQERRAGEQAGERDPHHALNNPASDPDPTEWPDPYDRRPDPLDSERDDGAPDHELGHAEPGATSTSQPPPRHDPDAEEQREHRDRDRLDQ